MRSLALLLCLALPAYADDLPVPCSLTPSERITLDQKLQSLQAQNDSLVASSKNQLPGWVPVVIGVVALGLGAAAGYGISRVAQK